MIEKTFPGGSSPKWWDNFVDFMWEEFVNTPDYLIWAAQDESSLWYNFVEDSCKKEGFEWDRTTESTTRLTFNDNKTMTIMALKWT